MHVFDKIDFSSFPSYKNCPTLDNFFNNYDNLSLQKLK